jgi:FemAB family protein
MIKKLQEITKNILNNIDFNLSDWNYVLSHSGEHSTYYLLNNINYFIAYLGKNTVNLSFVLYENQKAVGVFPLFAYRDNDKWVLSANGSDILEPLFVNNIGKKTKKRLEKSLVIVIIEMSKFLNITHNKISAGFENISTWYFLWLQDAKEEFITHHVFVDLRKDLGEIKLGFRRRYKPLVNKALTTWSIEVCNKIDIKNDFKAFRQLHIEAAGRETRSKKSWDIQLQKISDDEMFMVTVKNNGVLIGGGLFTYTKTMGIYAVGAYKRELFDKPIGHGVQMKAIEFLKEKGCLWYEIGQRYYLVDKTKPTEKELSISYFKEGFATHRFVKPHCIVNVK